MKHATTICLAILLLSAPANVRAADLPSNGKWFGTLQSKLQNADKLRAAGATMVTVESAWDQYEPSDGEFADSYARTLKDRVRQFQAKGFAVVLDLGLQYPPAWTRKLPGAAYQNQFGDAFESRDPGANGLNAVFSAAVRDKQARYVTRVLKQLGTDCHVVRLGGGFSGELNYPSHKYRGKENCYWAFDPIAQGSAKGLPKGLAPCPVPGWKPGEPTPDHAHARRFAEWYLVSLQNYHDWQIQLARDAGYQGKLAMLYPSWGIRPGQLDAAVRTDLSGTTSPEKNGEIQRGFDFARFIAGIRDKHVIVYCTWMDSDPKFGDDAAADAARWSPPHWLSSLAQSNKPPLDTWGENTGRGDLAAMKLSFARAREYRLLGLMWAFEGDLSQENRAKWSDLSEMLNAK